jgi:predicted transcriptional regulator
MTTEKKLMYGLDPSNYPTRLGQPWKDDEILKLLTSIQKKKSIEEIAKEHDRTEGGINSYIKKLAADYYFNDKRPIEEIQKFTGLTKEEIEDAIKMRERKNTVKKSCETSKPKVAKQKKATEEELPTMLEVVSLLKDIQTKLNTLLEKVA